MPIPIITAISKAAGVVYHFLRSGQILKTFMGNSNRSGDIKIEPNVQGETLLEDVIAETGKVESGSSGDLIISPKGPGNTIIRGGTYRTGDVGPKKGKTK